MRVATWNVTNYSSGRVAAFQTAIYGTYEGRSMAPDVLIGQEFLSQAGVDNFLSILNTAPGSPGDWAAAPFYNGPDTDNAFFYRTSKITLLAATTIALGGTSPNHPRNVERYDCRLNGYTSDGAVLACYSSHMKASSGSDNEARRLLEAQRIRDNAEGVDTNGPGSGLPAGWHFLLGGDFNIQQSTWSSYQELVGSQPNDDGRFFDPISTPGGWNNNSAFKIVHTQDPIGAGGMDDRHDQMLVSAGLIDGGGFDYIGNSTIPYSTTTWDDANHSYRSWGNDGTSFNVSLTVSGNAMVGASIAQALRDSALSGGHLPVFLDLRVPPHVDSVTEIDFGQVPQGASAEEVLTVTNDGDVALWTADGIADLAYSLIASAGFTAPVGAFTDSAGGSGNNHTIEMDTSLLGLKSGTLTVSSNAPDEPERVVWLLGEVIALCDACDTDCDGQSTMADIDAFVDMLLNGTAPCSTCAGDTSPDERLNGIDIESFIDCFLGDA